MKIKDVIEALERFAPLPLQEEYDNAGLQTGLTEAEVSGALLCLDVTEEVLREAAAQGLNMVIAHHPLLFRPLRHLTDGTQVERCVRYAVRHDIAVYAAHTNLDNARGGVNYEMGRRIGLEDLQLLQERSDGQGGSGVVGRLGRPMEAGDFLKHIKRTFRVECLQHNRLLDGRPIRKVALCGGAGDFLLPWALEAGADAFLTGEMNYHRFFGWEGRIQIGVLGHYQSEQFTQQLLQKLLEDSLPALRTRITTINTNPIHYL